MWLSRHYELPSARQGAVIAIGNFDAVHRGHAEVLRHVTTQARALEAPAAILTFEPHPRRFFAPDNVQLRLIPFHHKARLLQAAGVDGLIAQRFNAGFANLSAEAFIDEVLVRGLGARHVITGEEFAFGKGRRGHAGMLEAAARRGRFRYEAVTPLIAGEEKCSSTHIRAHVARGEMAEAADLLGYPYHWLGRVIRGDARGRALGYPTLNILPPTVLPPRRGVYAVRVQRFGEARSYDAVANLGYRPTFQGEQLRLEIHVLKTEIDWYDARICVEFHSHLRDEQPFEGVEALRSQIQQDCHQATAKLATIPAVHPWHAAPAS